MEFLSQNLAVFFGLIVLAFLSWRKSEYGIYAIIFSLPLYLIKLEVFSTPTTVLELGIYVLFLIYITKQYNNFSLRGTINTILDLKKTEKNLFWGIFLLLVGATISTIFSSDLKTSAGILKGWFFDPFLFFIILVLIIKTYMQKLKILKMFFLSGVIVAIVSLIYFVFPDLGGVSYDGRLHGFYLSPNHLAMYLSPAFLIGIWFVFRKYSAIYWKENSSNVMFILSLFDLLLIGLAIYFTYSYAAWLAIFIAIAILFYFIAGIEKKLSFQWKLSFLSSFLIIIILFLSQNGTSKFENLKNLSYRSSYNSRLMIWRSAWEIGKDHWLVGIGPGNFQKYYLNYQTRFSEPYLEWAVPQPHNIFLAFWLESSAIGLAGFILVLYWFFRKAKKIFKKTRKGRDGYNIAVVLCALMVYIVFHGFFDTTYWKNDLSVMFWLILGLMALEKE